MLRFVRSAASSSAGGCPAALASRLAPPRLAAAAALLSALSRSPTPRSTFTTHPSVCAPPHSAGARRWASVSAAAGKQSKASARTTTTAAAARRQASESQTLAAYTAALKRVPGQPAVTPTSAPGDQRAYRVITLDNGLRCALVSDPLSWRAAASLDLNVGSWSDPESLSGLAHLCQHAMLSDLTLSAATDSLDSYVSAHGGSSNARIEAEHSRLSFDVERAHLAEALGRFANIVENSSFSQEGIKRSVDALEAAYQTNLKPIESTIWNPLSRQQLYTQQLEQEKWQDVQLLRATANPQHPFARFAEGNHATLRDEPKAAGLNVREELIKFHRAHYTADRMSLAVGGHEPLDRLEQMVRGTFGSIAAAAATKASTPAVKSKSADARIDTHAFTSTQLGRLIQFDSRAHRVQFLWHFGIDAVQCYSYAQESLKILADLLISTQADTHELHSGDSDCRHPEEHVWIYYQRVYANVLISTSRFSLLSFTLELTDEGIKHTQEIVERVMGFIQHKLPRILQKELNDLKRDKKYRPGVDESALFKWAKCPGMKLTAEDKRKDADAKAGRFSPVRQLEITKASLPLVQRLSRALHVFPPERVVTESTVGLECSAATVEHFVALLNDPTRMRVHITAPRLAKEAKDAGVTLSERSGVSYLDEPMPSSMVSYIVQPRRKYPGEYPYGSRPTTNWRTLIGEALAQHSETWSDVEHCTLNRAALSKRFRLGYGAWAEPFTLWTATRVYSDQERDGAYFVTSRERHPPETKEKQ